MRALLLAFVAGCWLLQQQEALPAGWWRIAGGCTAGVVACLAPHARGRWRHPARWAAGMLLAVVVGFGWAGWRAELRLGGWLDAAMAGRDLDVDGIVAGLPDVADHGTRFVFLAQAWSRAAMPDGDGDGGHALPERMILTWRDPPDHLQPGQRYRMTVRLRRPRGLANPHGFDYAYWLLSQDVAATGYVRAGARLPAGGGVLSMPPAVRVATWRARIRDHVYAALPDNSRYGAVLVALVIGDQRGISQEDWDVFRRTGISHLVSISGLHITMISGLAGAGARAMWRRSFGLGGRVRRPLPLIWPAQKAALAVALAVALAYGAIAGMQIPALRTVTMLAVAALALWGGRAPPASLVLAWAAGVAMVIDPWAVMLPGFWLSFGAVAVIFLHAQGDMNTEPERADSRQRPERWLARVSARWRAAIASAARSQWAVTIGLVPLTLVLFGQVSVVSALANTVAIPLVSLLVTPLALAGAVLPPSLATMALTVAHVALAHLVDGLAWLARPSWAVWETAHPGPLATLSALIGVVLVLMPRPVALWRAKRSSRIGPVPYRVALRGLGVLAMLPMLAAAGEPVAEGEFRLIALDVGQGTSVLVETRAHALLYDAGPAYASGTSAGGQVIVPFLRANGVRRLDMLMVSHEDADHAGGVRDVLQAVPVAQGRTAAPTDHRLLRAGALEWQPCPAGTHWIWDGVRFEIVHPSEGELLAGQLESNARSCVLRIATARRSVLLTGDIGEREELRLIGREPPERLRADILLVPHHGSGTSSHAAFLRAVQPEVAIFQLGFANRYRHPRADVWRRYERAGIARYRTDETGAVSVATDGAGYTVTSYRQRHRRYWRDAPPAPR